MKSTTMTTTRVRQSLSVFVGLLALAVVVFGAAATAEANRIPPRPQPQPEPQPQREPVPRTYVFDALESYPDHTFVLSHRRTFPRSERVDYEAQVVEEGEPVELPFSSDNPRRVQSVAVRLHAVRKELPQAEDGEGVELCHDWLVENSHVTLDATGQFPPTVMYMNRDIRAETITYRPVIEETREDFFSLRIYRSRAERFDDEGNVIFSRVYRDNARPLREQRAGEDDKHANTDSTKSLDGAAAMPRQAGVLLLLSSLAGLLLFGVIRLRRFTAQ